MGLAAYSKDIIISPHNSPNTERGSPSPAVRTGGNLVARGIANPQEIPSCRISTQFESYLKAHNKRNIKQILCYAKRYHTVLETGNVSSLVNLKSGAV
jgi:hypothetical protein